MLLVSDELNNNLLLWLKLQHLEHQTHERRWLTVSSIRPPDVIEFHGTLYQRIRCEVHTVSFIARSASVYPLRGARACTRALVQFVVVAVQFVVVVAFAWCMVAITFVAAVVAVAVAVVVKVETDAAAAIADNFVCAADNSTAAVAY